MAGRIVPPFPSPPERKTTPLRHAPKARFSPCRQVYHTRRIHLHPAGWKRGTTSRTTPSSGSSSSATGPLEVPQRHSCSRTSATSSAPAGPKTWARFRFRSIWTRCPVCSRFRLRVVTGAPVTSESRGRPFSFQKTLNLPDRNQRNNPNRPSRSEKQNNPLRKWRTFCFH